MKNIYTFIIAVFTSISLIGQTQLGIVETVSGPQEITLQTDLQADYAGQTIAGIFFIVKMPIPTTDPNFVGFTSTISALNSGWIATGIDDDGVDRYYMYQNNNAFTAPANWTDAQGVIDLVAFNLNGGTMNEMRDVSLAADTDVIANSLIDAAFGPGASAAVYGSDIIDQFGSPTVTGYFADIVTGVILPIELRKFDVAKNGLNVILEWISASELNASHYEIERSQDGANWEYLGRVNAVGESTANQDYSFLDNTLPLNTRDDHKIFYYRLKMVDNDGASEYSDVRSVRFDLDGEADFLVYPNPSINEVYVNLSSITAETGPATLKIINMNGQLVKQVILQTSDDIRIDVSDMTAGIYNFVVRQNEQIYSEKIIKID